MGTDKQHDDGADDLREREEEILKSVIREHILTGDPIGSRTLSRTPHLDLSPASIRNVMAELAERGLLSQPHTSAGRVPTDRAYRWYVDRVVGTPRMPQSQTQAIEFALDASRGEIARLLAETSRQLSKFSNHVGVVLAPRLDHILVEHVEFVRLDARRVVAIVVGRAGVVHNRILETPEPLDQSDLDWAGNYLSEEFHGRTLPEIRELLRSGLSDERATSDPLTATSLSLGQRAIETGSAGEVFVDGAANLLSMPEFADPDKVRGVIRMLERKRSLVDLLGRVLDGDGVQVVIGDQRAGSDLADCSLVASTYGAEGRVMGTLGIVGPKRMEYARAMALVDYLARVLDRYFSASEIDEGRLGDQVP